MTGRDPAASAGIRRVGHTGITVGSLDESLPFWVDGLGFELAARHELAGDPVCGVTGVSGGAVSVAMLRRPDHVVELVEYSAPGERQVYRPRPCDVGSFHMAFIVEDIERSIERVTEHGGTALGTGPFSGPEAKAIYVRGPDGVTLELIQEIRAGEG